MQPLWELEAVTTSPGPRSRSYSRSQDWSSLLLEIWISLINIYRSGIEGGGTMEREAGTGFFPDPFLGISTSLKFNAPVYHHRRHCQARISHQCCQRKQNFTKKQVRKNPTFYKNFPQYKSRYRRKGASPKSHIFEINPDHWLPGKA